MRLTPRYGNDPLIELGGRPAAVALPAIRQRRRLAEVLASLDPLEWDHPSRCDGWSVRDVAVHLESVNAFWNFSIQAGVAGQPTTFLERFDPVATPAEIVAAAGDLSREVVLERFIASNEQLINTIESLDPSGWDAQAETPAGHLKMGALVHHALWDSWIHERDILLPLDREPVEEDDEVLAALRYSAALSPAVTLSLGRGGSGVVAVTCTRTGTSMQVVVDGTRVVVDDRLDENANPDIELRADGVLLAEALSCRRPLADVLPELPLDTAWLVEGLATVFGQR